MPQERQFTQKEVDALIQKALTFQTEPPERQKERVQKYLPVYLVCSVLGIVEALAVWGFRLAETEMAQMSLILGVGFGVVYGAYAFFWMTETLPRYFDENRIAQFPQPLQAKENASSRPRSGCVRVKSTCPHRSICESLSMFVLLFRLFWFYCSTKRRSTNRIEKNDR